MQNDYYAVIEAVRRSEAQKAVSKLADGPIKESFQEALGSNLGAGISDATTVRISQ